MRSSSVFCSARTPVNCTPWSRRLHSNRAPLVSRSLSLPMSSVKSLRLARHCRRDLWASASVRIPSAPPRVIRSPSASMATVSGTGACCPAAGPGSALVVIGAEDSLASPRHGRHTRLGPSTVPGKGRVWSERRAAESAKPAAAYTSRWIGVRGGKAPADCIGGNLQLVDRPCSSGAVDAVK